MKGKIFTLAVLFALIIIPNVASAKSLREIDNEIRERYQNIRNAYINARNAYITARNDWIAARNTYRQLRGKEHLENAKAKARNFLTAVCNRGIAYLNWIKIKIENWPNFSEEQKQAIIDEIESNIQALESKKEEVTNATTKQEFVVVANSILNKWKEVRVSVKRVTGRILIARVNYVINSAERLRDRIEGRIEILEESGKDVSELRNWLSDFSQKIELAKQKREQAKEKFLSIKTIKEADQFFIAANNFLKEANSYLRSAYHSLVKIVNEMRKKKWSVIKKGYGWIYANGNGTAILIGNGTVFAKAQNGSMLVTDFYGDAKITAIGEGRKEDYGNGTILYEGYGRIRVNGSNLTVRVEGTKIALIAYGKGKALLKGNGTYKSGKLVGGWSGEGTSINVEGSQ